MKTYKVQITETLQKIIKVDADNDLAAQDYIVEQYGRADIILDAEDFKGVEFEVLESPKNGLSGSNFDDPNESED